MGERWVRFFDAAGAEPRETLLLALDRYTAEANEDSEPLAVDLGCGAGRDSLELLRRGWRVLAIDAHPEALKRLREKAVTLQLAARLETLQSPFEAAVGPALDCFSRSRSAHRIASMTSGGALLHRSRVAVGSAVNCSASATNGRAIAS